MKTERIELAALAAVAALPLAACSSSDSAGSSSSSTSSAAVPFLPSWFDSNSADQAGSELLVLLQVSRLAHDAHGFDEKCYNC